MPNPPSPKEVPLLEIVELLHHPNFYWGAMGNGLTRAKYINVVVDTRDNMCLMFDRDDKPITIEELRKGVAKPIMAEMNENPRITITHA